MKKLVLLFLIVHVFFCLFWISVSGQEFYNLDFKQICDTTNTGLCYWDLSWGGENAVKPDLVDSASCLLLFGKTENSVGFVEQTVVLDNSDGIKIITVSASIKSDSVKGKGAGLNVGLYDKNGMLIATKDMGGFYSLDWINGSSDWTDCSISLVCPIETVKIKIGAILYGKGNAWFKEYKVDLTPINHRIPSKLALDYVNEACQLIETNSLVRDSIDIESLKKTALKIAGDAKKYTDCYLAINYLLESLRIFGDDHSFFMTAAELENWENEGSLVSIIEYPAYKTIESCGYIKVPPFHGGNPKQVLSFADSLQMAIQILNNSRIMGWIIDLRSNTGGNMEPMIAGLGPLFSQEKIGSLIDVNGNADSWYYARGKYYWDSDTALTVSNPVNLSNKLPIAVLTGNQTGSSGEAVVVSFIGNQNTRSFGQPTYGLTTGNGSFELMDGSQIFLASTTMADRNGNQYNSSIAPDMVIDEKVLTDNDGVIAEAILWIMAEH